MNALRILISKSEIIGDLNWNLLPALYFSAGELIVFPALYFLPSFQGFIFDSIQDIFPNTILAFIPINPHCLRAPFHKYVLGRSNVMLSAAKHLGEHIDPSLRSG